MIRIFEPKHNSDGVPYLYGRNNILAKIHDYIVDNRMPENIALLGVKGVGKTSIIRCAFSNTNLRKYYDEGSVLVAFVSIPESTDSMKGFYSYLNTSILEAIDMMEEYDKFRYDSLMTQILNKKNKILSRCVEIDDATMESVLNKTIEIVKNDGLKLLVVFDDFERFADSSNLKKAQYKFMREIANSEKISMFISTGQDLTKVSEEMKGSGFENIFRYEELRGIKVQDIEDWMFDITDETEVEFNDEIIEWIEDISGGIPELVGEAAELSFTLLSEGEVFNSNVFFKKLYPIVYPLMKKWWLYTDDIEHQIFENLIEDKSEPSVNRDCLIKKGYLDETDANEAVYVSPLFEMYVLEMMTDKKTEVEIQDFESIKELREMLSEIVKEANENMEAKIEKIDSRIEDITDKLSSIITEMPSRDDFYKEDDGEFDPEKYREAISSYISDKLTSANDDEICTEWNIDKKMWNLFPDVRKNDCSMAYRLISIVFSEDIDGVDYTPVTVMLGNFLEGLLNDNVLDVLKRYLPNVRVKNQKGKYGPVSECKGTLTIGGFEYTFRNEDVAGSICGFEKSKELGINNQIIKDFAKKLTECHKIRNTADHPGNITTYRDKNQFVNNMFKGKNSMVAVMAKLNQLP